MPDYRTSAERSARAFTLLFLACLAILGFALYLQHVKNLDPCPWCVVQRVGFIAFALVALAAVLVRPARGGIVFFAVLAALVALAGAAAAGYHIGLQSDPARAEACAGSMVERILDASHIGRWIPPLLQYDGPCTLKPWSLAGLSIPEWSLVCFVLLFIAALAVPFFARR